MEYIVVIAVVVAFAAIALRFMPRDAGGARHLPRVVDESVGMEAVRRLRSRLAVAEKRRPPPVAAIPAVTEPHDNLAGVAPGPTVPTRLVISRGTQQAHPLGQGSPPPRPIPGVQFAAYSPARRRARRRPANALALERRIAGVLGIAAIAILVLALAFVPRGFGGEVLTATGTPGISASTGVDGSASPEPTSSPSPSPTPSPSPSPSPTASPTPSPTASPTPSPTPTRTPRPTPTPTRTPRPTPTPTPTPTPPPSPTPTPATPTPTVAPTPTPSAETPPPSSSVSPSPVSPAP